MEKTAFIIAILTGIIFTSMCCRIDSSEIETAGMPKTHRESTNSQYGTYLAGRVAYMRHDLNRAADYYMRVSKDTPKTQMLPSVLYVMLTSQGRIDEAVKYADQAMENNDPSPFIHTVKAVYEAKHQNFNNVLNYIKHSDDELFAPLMTAWAYAGIAKYDAALNALGKMLKNPALRAVYLFHAGAISDYCGKNTEADKYYSLLLDLPKTELSVFPAQVIANFYNRQGNADKIEKVLQKMGDETNMMITLAKQQIKSLDSSSAPILTSPAVGMADALFGIALILQHEESIEQIPMLFASLAAYLNEDYDLPQIFIGNLWDNNKLYREANKAYAKVKPDQIGYYAAQFQIGKNLLMLKEYTQSEAIFKRLLRNFEPTQEVYITLGELMRATSRYRQSIRYYNESLDFFDDEKESWAVLFAIGIAYDRMGDYDAAEKYFRLADEHSPTEILKNYIGYTLIRQGKNIEEAFELLIAAYMEEPLEGTIVDSMGWAFYQIGDYERAITFLERASNLAPSEALIYDHLGDAYWEAGRKDEAYFQWNHAAALKDDSEEMDKDIVLQKIKNGKQPHIPVSYDRKKVEELIEKSGVLEREKYWSEK
ncbi:MAG: tetratricopeptide repeat protein [Alphaproteobacteria bacterium]|nr:tetratricopeptide repeat protein [Alphaproteobacteria bacterium]